MKMIKKVLIIAAAAIAIGIPALWACFPEIGAQAIIIPYRKPVETQPPKGMQEVAYHGDGVQLKGWQGEASQPFRGSLIYLHGVADNRVSGSGMLETYQSLGFDVVAYDSRGHGSSEGTYCTYGYHEKRDLSAIIDTLRPGPVILIGSSMGAAVALQAAAEDDRISLVVAAESFSSLKRIIQERAPSFVSQKALSKSISIAEQKASFSAEETSPVHAASKISAPILIIHGEQDTDTPSSHSTEIHQALRGNSTLILVPGAGHGESLRGQVMEKVKSWILKNLPAPE